MTVIRRANTDDVKAIIDLMYKAYAPVRELGIQFESAHPTIAVSYTHLTLPTNREV